MRVNAILEANTDSLEDFNEALQEMLDSYADMAENPLDIVICLQDVITN